MAALDVERDAVVERQALARALRGQNAGTGEQLRPPSANGVVNSYDLMMGVPRSLSVLWAQSDAERRDAIEYESYSRVWRVSKHLRAYIQLRVNRFASPEHALAWNDSAFRAACGRLSRASPTGDAPVFGGDAQLWPDGERIKYGERSQAVGWIVGSDAFSVYAFATDDSSPEFDRMWHEQLKKSTGGRLTGQSAA